MRQPVYHYRVHRSGQCTWYTPLYTRTLYCRVMPRSCRCASSSCCFLLPHYLGVDILAESEARTHEGQVSSYAGGEIDVRAVTYDELLTRAPGSNTHPVPHSCQHTRHTTFTHVSNPTHVQLFTWTTPRSRTSKPSQTKCCAGAGQSSS
jgi:hypothetical protein